MQHYWLLGFVLPPWLRSTTKSRSERASLRCWPTPQPSPTLAYLGPINQESRENYSRLTRLPSSSN